VATVRALIDTPGAGRDGLRDRRHLTGDGWSPVAPSTGRPAPRAGPSSSPAAGRRCPARGDVARRPACRAIERSSKATDPVVEGDSGCSDVRACRPAASDLWSSDLRRRVLAESALSRRLNEFTCVARRRGVIADCPRELQPDDRHGSSIASTAPQNPPAWRVSPSRRSSSSATRRSCPSAARRRRRHYFWCRKGRGHTGAHGRGPVHGTEPRLQPP
jgi:hypothetical protein